MFRTLCTHLLLFFASSPAHAGVPEDIARLSKPSPDPAANRAAWDRLVAVGPPAIITILKAWPTDDPVATNWLRTALDRIAPEHSDSLPFEDLLAFVDDPKSPSKARPAALAVVERSRPGTTGKRLPGWLNDPEFSPDAVAERLAAADTATDPEQTRAILRTTFAATTDVDQALAVAKKL